MHWFSSFMRQQRLDTAGECLPLVHPDFPVVICWRPKSACTTLLKWFLFHTGLQEESLTYSKWPHDYREQILFASPGYSQLCIDALVAKDRLIVKAIRDPARRVVSNFLQVIRNLSVGNISSWPDIAAWKQSMRLGDQVGLSFHQFMRYILDRRGAGHALDAHLCVQWCPIQDSRVDEFMPVENLTDELRTLERRLGLPPSPLNDLVQSVHHNVPTPANRWERGAIHAVLTPALLKQFGTPSADVFLDEETVGLIGQVYSEDYTAYGMFYDPAAPASFALRHQRG
jgi:hypothetical protein